MQEKKALSSRGRGRVRGFLELRRPWGFSHEARRGSQGAPRAAPGKSGWLDGITNAMDMSLGGLRQWVIDREAWRAAAHAQAVSAFYYKDD